MKLNGLSARTTSLRLIDRLSLKSAQVYRGQLAAEEDRHGTASDVVDRSTDVTVSGQKHRIR